MSEKREIIRSIAVLTLICIVISGALAVVNSFTAPVSRVNAAAREDEARRQLIPDAAEFSRIENADLPAQIVSVYAALDAAGENAGYVFTVNGSGFGGTISVLCAIGADGNILSCQALDVSSETKTLGGKVANTEYSSQYTGADADLSGIDAISGATITSDAYKGCVQAAFEAYAQIQEAAE